ncbi:MAG: globin family protein [bacterium]|nr:globin family protein [bacterium]
MTPTDTLTDQQRRLVTDSFAQLVPISAESTTLFYNRLWEIAPETKPLFNTTDMAAQGMKLMQTLGVAVRALHDLDSLRPFLLDLGQRHIGYGVSQEQYAAVGAALLWMLEQSLGDEFTPELHQAWDSAYRLISDITQQVYDQRSA